MQVLILQEVEGHFSHLLLLLSSSDLFLFWPRIWQLASRLLAALRVQGALLLHVLQDVASMLDAFVQIHGNEVASDSLLPSRTVTLLRQLLRL